MTTKERYAGVIKWFQENKPIAETELQYHDPFQLLIAVILSAQCTDIHAGNHQNIRWKR